MRIQYSLSTFLSILVVLNACQDGTHQASMNGNDTHAHGCTKEENGMALTLSEAIVSGHPGAITQNGNGHVSPATSSNDVLVSIGEQLVTTPSQHHETMDAKPPAAEVVQSTGIDEKKEEALQESLELEMWFQRFVDAVDHAEDWDEVAGVLAAGKRRGYLDRRVAWDDDQYTPLHYVAEGGDLEVVQELIEKYHIPVDIRTGGGKRAPLHLAALQGQLAVVAYLLNQGAALHAIDKDGSHPLHYAVLGVKGKANTEVAAYLHGKGADLGIVLKGFNLLHLAIRAGNVSLVSYLLEERPDLIHQEVDGITPLAYAQSKQEVSIAEAIQEKVDDQSKPCWSLLPNCRIH